MSKLSEMTVDSVQSKKKAYNRAKRNDLIFVWGMLALPILHFLIFWLYINSNTIFMTFFRYNPNIQGYQWYGLNNFINLFEDMFLGGDPRTFNSMLNSLVIFPVNNFIILPLSFIAAYFLSKKIPLHNFFRVLFFMPSMISITVLALCYRSMFDTDHGPIFMLLNAVLGGKAPDFLDATGGFAMPIAFSFAVWSGLGYNIVLLNGAISRIPEEILESARLDGISTTRELFNIVLPLSWGTISTLFILNSLSIFGWFLPPMLVISDTGGVNGKTSTIALYVYQLVNAGKGEEAAALGLMFSLIGIPFVFGVKWLMDKITPTIEF